jgi:hypothetical protein
MTLGGLGGEPNRVKVGLVFLLLGGLLLAWAWGSWVYRTATTRQVPDAVVAAEDSPPVTPEKKAAAARSLSLVLLTGLALFLVVLLGSFVIVRYGRSYFDGISRRRAAPTTHSSVWDMHRPPRPDEGEEEEDRSA